MYEPHRYLSGKNAQDIYYTKNYLNDFGFDRKQIVKTNCDAREILPIHRALTNKPQSASLRTG